MDWLEIFLIGVGLAMDAFAVSITKGLAMKRLRVGDMLLIALFFGGFQCLMPLIGWALGNTFISFIDAYDHWVAFILLALIGGKNLVEAIRMEQGDGADAAAQEATSVAGDVRVVSIPELFMLAIATSIDALAVGVTFAMMPGVNVPAASALIGIVTFAICCGGVLIGRTFGTRYKRKAAIAGGLILIAIGLRILFDGLGIFM